MNTKDKNKLRVTGKTAGRRTVSAKRPQKQPEAQILYTPAKPFNRNRFLLRLATVAAVVLALVFGMSIFFKVGYVTVSGAKKYTPWEVKQAAQIQDGEGLLSISEAKISAKIRTELPYVAQVRVGIKLPDTVNIEIKELDVAYAIEEEQAGWALIDAQGRIVEKINAATAKGYTKIVGVKIQSAEVGSLAIAAKEEIPEEADDESQTEEGEEPGEALIPEIPVDQMLEAAVKVLQALENNGVLGDIDSIDVSDVTLLSLWYDGRYQVTLGNTARLDYKISAMKAAIQQMGEYQNGYLDVSFTLWPDQVGYTPFDSGK